MRFIALTALCFLASCATPSTQRIAQLQSQVPAPIEEQLKQLGRVVAPPQTSAIYAPIAEKEPYQEVVVKRDLAYGTDPRHILDVFQPSKVQPARPVLVFVHGGAFIGGNKRTGDSPFYDNVALWAISSGMVGVNITYRLAPKHQWPEAQRDLAQAIDWVRENISTFGGDPSRIYLMGHSAGAAHVAQYVGHPEFQRVPNGGISGAIMISGLFDTVTMEKNPPFQAYFGKDESQYENQSALKGMLASEVPMMFAYAELDPQDFHQQNQQVFSALCAAKKCPDSYLLLGHSHMSELYSLNTGDRALGDAISDFVRRHR